MAEKPVMARLWGGVIRYALKFGVVGILGYIVDVGIFNLLRLHANDAVWFESVIGAKTVSTTAAIIFNWVGNRYWVFRHHRRKNYISEFIEYVVVSVGGLLIALGCLWVSHHVLGFSGLVADNISANVVGLGLGTIFRFALYRYWVYGAHRSDGLSPDAKVEEAQRSLFEEPTGSIPAVTDPRSTGE